VKDNKIILREDALESTAKQLVAEGKGILAADESLPTIEKRFASINLSSSAINRRKYRQLLFSTQGLENFISGVILFEETLHQKTEEGSYLPEILSAKGIIPGVKVDRGTVALPGFSNEKVTQGLDGLYERLVEYKRMGALFTKWRAVISIHNNHPSHFSIKANAHALARFAASSQEAHMVPVVEPEVLMDGYHTLGQCEEVSAQTLVEVFNELFEHRVKLEGSLLKASMVIPGSNCSKQASTEEVAKATLRVLYRTVPAAIPGIVFLSGGQSPTQASAHLNAMNALGPHPWELSFSFGRALQEPVLKAWKGNDENIESAQKQLHFRAELNSAARYGTYSHQLESRLA